MSCNDSVDELEYDVFYSFYLKIFRKAFLALLYVKFGLEKDFKLLLRTM